MYGNDLYPTTGIDVHAGWSISMVPSIGIVGAGHVGSALGDALARHGYRISAVWSRDSDKRDALAAVTGASALESASAVVYAADLTLLTVSDDALADTAALIAGQIEDSTGKAIVHTSGAATSSVLAALVERGMHAGSLHPAHAFAGGMLPAGITFAVEAKDEVLSTWLRGMVAALSGRVITLSASQKAVYHTALVMLSNYTVTLYDTALRLLLSLNAERDSAESAMLALLRSTTHNIGQFGVPDALTGPLVRGDVSTVSTHLNGLSELPDVRRAYEALARLTLPMLRERGVDTRVIERLLNEKE